MVDESTEQIAGLNSERILRRRFLTAAAVTGIAIGAGGYVHARQQGQEIKLVGRVEAWEGVAPAEIEGQSNPTLTLTAGQDYTVTWENGDGARHNFAIRNANGENIVRSDFLAEEGATESVQFTASEDMVQYVCEVHPSSMVGDVEVTGGTPAGTPTETETPEETPDETPEETPGVAGGQFVATLSGEGHGIDTPASGRAEFEVDGDAEEVHYTLRVEAFCDATMAHIHLGAEGEDGPVVVWLYPTDQQEPRTKDGRFTGTLAEGTFTADDFVGPLAGQSLRDLVNALRERGAYVNVHTEDHPKGEIRGQIEPADEG